MSGIVMNREKLMEILPHRDPMLLVDEVRELKPMEHIETALYIDPKWDVFRGHFPGAGVLPGVLSVECIAQAADIMVMTSEKYAALTPLFAGIDKARFSRKIVPGDCAVAKVTVVEVFEEKAMITCRGQLLVDDEVAATAQITIAMR